MNDKIKNNTSTSGKVANLNDLRHLFFDFDASITEVEISCEKACCVLDSIECEHLDKDSQYITELDRWAFVANYKTLQTKTYIVQDYMFKISRAIKAITESNDLVSEWFKALKTAEKMEYTRQPQ